MYRPFHKETAIAHLQPLVRKFSEPELVDGLVVLPPEAEEGQWELWEEYDVRIEVPPRLNQWFKDLRLLRHVPLSYLVPDPRLLPPESIRFFYVDPTWTDRMVDGVLSVGNIGVLDKTFSVVMLNRIRTQVDAQLEKEAGENWNANTDLMTGVLIRSELVRRWPTMIVRGYSDLQANGKASRPVAVLRKEAISANVMIVLFAGEPKQVEIREPDVGTRFGVESKDANNPGKDYQVNARNWDGSSDGIYIPTPFKDSNNRVLNVFSIATWIKDNASRPWMGPHDKRIVWKGPDDTRTKPGSRDVAMALEQLPYVQIFRAGQSEKDGFKEVFTFDEVHIRHGRVMKIQPNRG